MIFFDTETTGLITNEALPLRLQPQIIELGLVKCDWAGEILETFSAFCRPAGPLDPVITKITGLRDEDLKDAPLFATHAPRLIELFLGEQELIAHNITFDHGMLLIELRRLGKEFRFPWPPVMLDTLEIYRGKLAAWGKEVKGDAYVQTHRALDDAMLLRECYLAWHQKQEPAA